MIPDAARPRDEEQARLEAFAAHRRYLLAVAYRLLGLAEDAEDVLQEAWLRFASAHVEDLDNPRAYLVTIVSRLALDELRSARHRREAYVGLWLPEPVVTEESQPAELAELAESASFAFLLLLERLNPVERAVVVLHDVFDFSHEEIARITDRTAVSSRQTLHRARGKLGGATRPALMSAGDARIPAFLEATRTGDVRALLDILAPDVVLLSDGGGKVRTVNRVLVGSGEVGRFLAAMSGMVVASSVRSRVANVNGQPALLTYLDGALDTVFLFDATSAGITAIYAVRNPEKLRRLAARAG